MKRTSKAGAAPAGRALPLAAAVLGAALWILPLPQPAIEQWYSRGFYPRWQQLATTVSNFVPIALFDLIVVVLAVLIVRTLVRARRAGSWKAAGIGLFIILGTSSLWFHLAWGLNYRRTPIAASLHLDAAAADAEALARFGARAADASRALADRLDRRLPPTRATAVADLSAGFTRAERLLGLAGGARAGRPKLSVFDPYFRWAAIDGVTNPFVPEIMVVSTLTPAELHSTVAHEWGHLAGYASEDDASFAGWLMCIESEGAPRYSGWLFALTKAMGGGSRAQRAEWLRRAGSTVAADLRAIQERFDRTSPAVRSAASAAYDRFLRANRVEEGIRSYDAVLRLMLSHTK